MKIKNKEKNDIVKIILIVLLSKILIWVIAYIGWNVIPLAGMPWDPNIYTHNLFLQLWTRWDAGWYLRIAKVGYNQPVGDILPYNFFPLYPLLINFFALLLKDFALSGFLISNFMTFVAAFYLFQLAKLEFNTKIAENSIFYFVIFPSAFFLSAVYSEALFIALTISTFYYARKKNWLASGVLGFFSSMTRPVGFLIFFPMVYEYFKQNKNINKNFFYLLLIPLGFILITLYFGFLSGDFLVNFHARATKEWNREFTIPFMAIINDFKPIFAGHDNINSIFMKGMNFGFLIFFIILFLYSFRRLRKTYSIFLFVNLLLFISQSTLESLNRYLLAVFPIYFILGKVTTKNKTMNIFMLIFFSILLVIFTILFVNWYNIN